MASAKVTMGGKPVVLSGAGVKVGDPAPEFTAVGVDLAPVSFSEFRGNPCLISAVVSLDTDVCDLEARRFNKEVAALGGNVQVLLISMDLPFAQKRWAREAEADELVTLSDHKDCSFGLAYGLLIKDVRLLARAVYVIDAQGVIRYAEVVREVSEEPDYDAALAALRKVV